MRTLERGRCWMALLQPRFWGHSHHLSALSKRSSSPDSPSQEPPSPTGDLDLAKPSAGDPGLSKQGRRQGSYQGQLRGPHLPRILLTQPWLTRSCREMSQGRTPWWASSTMRCLTTSGRGLPFTNTPPSWFTPPCPAGERQEKKNNTPHTAGTGH